MSKYKLTLDDFTQAFSFAIDYYIDPGKNTTGRTTGEPRGLGAVLDAFTLGKLTEIGVANILKKNNSNKEYILDFDIKANSSVKDEADIVKIKEKGTERDPDIFIEIKNTSYKDRWIGLTEEQFKTIRASAGTKEIYMVYASIESDVKNDNPKTVDLTGMFLNEINVKNKENIFKKFANINSELKIEFIVSSEDLNKFSYAFNQGMNMYETNLFEEKTLKSVYIKSGLKYRKDIKSPKKFEYTDYEDILLYIEQGKKAENTDISTFQIKGKFKLLSKKKKKIIECLSDVEIKNKIFGKFILTKGKLYSFNLVTVGQNPILKRNNLFIAKRRIYQLLSEKSIESPDRVIKHIADKI